MLRFDVLSLLDRGGCVLLLRCAALCSVRVGSGVSVVSLSCLFLSCAEGTLRTRQGTENAQKGWVRQQSPVCFAALSSTCPGIRVALFWVVTQVCRRTPALLPPEVRGSSPDSRESAELCALLDIGSESLVVWTPLLELDGKKNEL